jgi:hypothetical protein
MEDPGIDRKFVSSTTIDKQHAHERWDGKPPKFSSKRTHALEALREFESLRDNDELPDRRKLLGGRSLACLYVRGKAYAYPVTRTHELSKPNENGPCLTPRLWLAIAWVLTAMLGYRKQGLYAKHRDMAALLHCSERTAGSTMRTLIDMGLVRAVPMHARCRSSGKHERKAYVFSVSARVMAFLQIRSVPDWICQPAEKHRVISASTNSGLEHETPGVGDGGAPPLAAGESIVTVPDATPDDDLRAVGVKARSEASPEGFPGGGADEDPPLARLAGELEEFKACVVRDARRDLARARLRDAVTLSAKLHELEARGDQLAETVAAELAGRGRGRRRPLAPIADETAKVPEPPDPVDLEELRRSVAPLPDWQPVRAPAAPVDDDAGGETIEEMGARLAALLPDGGAK